MTSKSDRPLERTSFTEPFRLLAQPLWILALIVALLVAAVFAALGQWQLSRAVDSAAPSSSASSETVKALETVLEPDSQTPTTATGQRVLAEGTYAAGDAVVLSNREQHKQNGYWVVNHFTTAQGSLPVALGWTANQTVAETLATALNTLNAQTSLERVTGRFVPTEAPVTRAPLSSLAVAELINIWPNYAGDPVYNGYIIADSTPPNLQQINAPPPTQSGELNWLNVFYAIEWVVFAVLATLLWYRLARDQIERKKDELIADARDITAETPGQPGGLSSAS